MMTQKERLNMRLAEIKANMPKQTAADQLNKKKAFEMKMAENYGSYTEYLALEKAGFFDQVK